MCGAVLPLPNTPSWHGAQLKYRDGSNDYEEAILETSYCILFCGELNHRHQFKHWCSGKAIDLYSRGSCLDSYSVCLLSS
jgi:hypothetical protein